MKLYFLPLCVAAILWGCGHDKEKKREEEPAEESGGYEIPDFLKGLDDTDIVKID